MSSKSATKQSKQAEQAKPAVESKEEMETQHSIWYGRLKSKPQDAKVFREFVIELGKTFVDEEGIKDIISHFWGKSIEELDIVIKNQHKREKKVKSKFTPPDMVKAKTALNLYTKDFVAECKAKEIKFTLSGLNTSWKELAKKKKDTYIQAALEEKKAYNLKYNELKAEAIKNGSLSNDKPKGPVTAFFRYLADNREKIKEKLVKSGEVDKLNTKITSEAGKLWKDLSDKAKEPYELAYKEEKEKYVEQLANWKVTETNRLKKLDGKSDDINVEESGDVNTITNDIEKLDIKEEKVSKTKKTSKTAEAAEVEVTKAVKSEKSEKTTKADPKVESKTTKGEKSAKTEKAAKVTKKVNLTEDEDDDEE